jgi:hypothetical protein
VFSNPGRREKVLDELNRDQMDDVGPVWGDKGEKFLRELHEIQEMQC